MQPLPSHRRTRRGFSLAELLVVLGVIALLMAILLPSLSAARRSAMRTSCRSNLREIGHAFNLYLDAQAQQRVPRVNPLPSMVPSLVPGAPSPPEALEPYLAADSDVWRCPADRISRPATLGVPAGFETYHERETTSYLYNTFFNAFSGGDAWQQALGAMRQRGGGGSTPSETRLFTDFEPFHNTAGKPGAMNYLFADFHVGEPADAQPTIVIFDSGGPK